MDTVLIPAYEPDHQLPKLAKRLQANGFHVLIVDDGSGPDYGEIFTAASEFATVVAHPHNMGKGAALKTGMRYIRDHLPECEHFITCDADGQHKVEDVVRVQQKLHNGHRFVLTMRKARKGIPLRSKVGNTMSRIVYALLTNRYLSDNQSGLRGFHYSHIDWMIQVEKNNYDYEMNVLYYAAKKSVHITTLPIEAIYIDNNQSSHFSPIKDTVRIYKSLFSLAAGTFASFGMAEILMLIVSIVAKHQYIFFTVPIVGALAYVAHIIIGNFIIFRKTTCYDYLTTLFYTVLSYFVYTLSCMALSSVWPGIPLFLIFNIVYFACLPLRYLLHRTLFVAQRTHE